MFVDYKNNITQETDSFSEEIELVKQSKVQLINKYFKNETIDEIKSLDQVFFKIKYIDNLWLKYTFYFKKIYRTYFIVMSYKKKNYTSIIKYNEKNEVKQLVIFINKNY